MTKKVFDRRRHVRLMPFQVWFVVTTMLFRNIDFMDFEPCKGFKCSKYF